MLFYCHSQIQDAHLSCRVASRQRPSSISDSLPHLHCSRFCFLPSRCVGSVGDVRLAPARDSSHIRLLAFRNRSRVSLPLSFLTFSRAYLCRASRSYDFISSRSHMEKVQRRGILVACILVWHVLLYRSAFSIHFQIYIRRYSIPYRQSCWMIKDLCTPSTLNFPSSKCFIRYSSSLLYSH